MQKSKSGFTIVELLIVIVVIAILAAISIVAYNGIQQRARNAQVTAGAEAYYKAILHYQTINGSYPTVPGCLGANYPNNRCWEVNGNPDRGVNAVLDEQLEEFIPNKPTLATSLLRMNPGGTTLYDRAGLVYLYNNATDITLRYYLEGLNQGCISGFTAANEGVLSRCIKTLSN